MKKHILGVAGIALATLLTAPMALAAAPDGNGPWADSVVSSAQGLAKNGGAVAGDRSNSSSAVGVAESSGAASDASATSGTFYSLGFGGTLTLGFTNTIENKPGNDIQVYEVTTGTYPDEKVKVEASPDGTNWIVLSNSVARDGGVDLGDLKCAKYVRLTDVSGAAEFEDTADGYDVDAVKALNYSKKKCKTKKPCEVRTQGHAFYGNWNNNNNCHEDDECKKPKIPTFNNFFMNKNGNNNNNNCEPTPPPGPHDWCKNWYLED